MALAIESIVSRGIIAQLKTSAELVTLVQDSKGQTKIFWAAAPDSVTAPYVLMTNVFGGNDNKSPHKAFDVTWRIEGVDASTAKAQTLSNLIYTALEGSYPAYGGGFKAWIPVTYQGPFVEQDNSQGTKFWKQGGIYRFRGIEEY